MHTTFSDGKNSIEEMIDTAQKLGLNTIAITDHIWRSSQWFDHYCSIIEKENKKNLINILVGFEAKALSTNGEIDATSYMCEKANIRIGAIHRIPSSNIKDEYLSREYIVKNNDIAYNNWLITTTSLIKNKDIDIIAHPCMALNKYNLKHKEEDIYNLFLLAKKYNKKLEISSRYKNANHFLWDIIRDKSNLLPYISYGSDAHSINELIKAHK